MERGADGAMTGLRLSRFADRRGEMFQAGKRDAAHDLFAPICRDPLLVTAARRGIGGAEVWLLKSAACSPRAANASRALHHCRQRRPS